MANLFIEGIGIFDLKKESCNKDLELIGRTIEACKTSENSLFIETFEDLLIKYIDSVNLQETNEDEEEKDELTFFHIFQMNLMFNHNFTKSKSVKATIEFKRNFITAYELLGLESKKNPYLFTRF